MIARLLVDLFPAVSAAISLLVTLALLVRSRRRKPLPESPVLPEIDSHAETALRREISALSARIAGLESRGATGGAGAIRSGMNLSKRTQALRLHRLGQGPDAIAKSLDMTQGEVTLLLKVQRIVSAY